MRHVTVYQHAKPAALTIHVQFDNLPNDTRNWRLPEATSLFLNHCHHNGSLVVVH
jgi:hypothetical protein